MLLLACLSGVLASSTTSMSIIRGGDGSIPPPPPPRRPLHRDDTQKPGQSTVSSKSGNSIPRPPPLSGRNPPPTKDEVRENKEDTASLSSKRGSQRKFPPPPPNNRNGSVRNSERGIIRPPPPRPPSSISRQSTFSDKKPEKISLSTLEEDSSSSKQDHTNIRLDSESNDQKSIPPTPSKVPSRMQWTPSEKQESSNLKLPREDNPSTSIRTGTSHHSWEMNQQQPKEIEPDSVPNRWSNIDTTLKLPPPPPPSPTKKNEETGNIGLLPIQHSETHGQHKVIGDDLTKKPDNKEGSEEPMVKRKQTAEPEPRQESSRLEDSMELEEPRNRVLPGVQDSKVEDKKIEWDRKHAPLPPPKQRNQSSVMPQRTGTPPLSSEYNYFGLERPASPPEEAQNRSKKEEEKSVNEILSLENHADDPKETQLSSDASAASTRDLKDGIIECHTGEGVGNSEDRNSLTPPDHSRTRSPAELEEERLVKENSRSKASPDSNWIKNVNLDVNPRGPMPKPKDGLDSTSVKPIEETSNRPAYGKTPPKYARNQKATSPTMNMRSAQGPMPTTEMAPSQERKVPLQLQGSRAHPNDTRYAPPPTGQQTQHFQGQQRQPPPQQVMNRPGHQYRNPPSAHASPSRSGATGASWKMLWKKVEKGLDGLADLEESVTERAQQFVSSAVGVAKSAPRSLERPSLARPAIFNRNSSPPKGPSKPASAAFAPYGSKYEVAAKANAQREQGTTAQQESESRKFDLNDLMSKKMISANGGAAIPSNQIPPTPPNMASTRHGKNSPSLRVQQPQPLQQSPQSPSVPATTINAQQQMQAPSSSSTASSTGPHPNPYEQMRASPAAKAATGRTDHSRASRIPWDSSVPSNKAASKQVPPRPSRLVLVDDEKISFGEKISNILPSLPRIRVPNLLKLFRKNNSYQYAGMDAWRDDDDEISSEKAGLFGLFRRKPKRETSPTFSSPRNSATDFDKLAAPLESMMTRCDHGNSVSLLSDADRRQAQSIGRRFAVTDGIASMFLLLALQQVQNLGAAVPTSINDLFSATVPRLASSLLESLDTWAPFLFISSFLTVFSADLLYKNKLAELASTVSNTVKSESQYSQLYLRLATALPVDPKLPTRIADAAVSQIASVVSIARLRAYVTFTLGLLAIMTSSILAQVFAVMGDGLWRFLMLEHWHSWPIEWKALGTSLVALFRSVYLSSEALIAKDLTQFLDSPMKFAFHLCIAACLLLTAILPSFEEKRRLKPLTDDEDDFAFSPAAGVEQLAKLGASSASRLSLLSENFSIENALERWRLTSSSFAEGRSAFTIGQMLRSLGYSALSAILCIFPLVVAHFVGALSFGSIAKSVLRWDSAVDVSIVLLCTYQLVSSSLKKATISTESRRYVDEFLSTLTKTVKEIKESNKSKAGIQFMSSVSPTAGLQVRDLWASHTSKRAWAVRGASLVCKNGDVLVVLGDDEAGKTRLLTTICENLIFPPQRSCTTNKVRGSVSVGGVDGSKWDQPVLKRRLGILLSDVRTMADTATLFSGWTMEELLEPVDGLKTLDPSHKLSSSERSSIILALKVCRTLPYESVFFSSKGTHICLSHRSDHGAVLYSSAQASVQAGYSCNGQRGGYAPFCSSSRM